MGEKAKADRRRDVEEGAREILRPDGMVVQP